MSILIEAAGVGKTYSCREYISIPADGRFVSVPCEFVFHRRSASYVDEMVAGVKELVREEEAGSKSLVDLILPELVSLTVKATGSLKSDKLLESPEEIRAALDVAGVPLQAFEIWAGSHKKEKRKN